MITIVKRTRKHEAEAAVNELVKRGFEVIHPITEMKKIGVTHGRYRNRRTNMSTEYVAKLRAGERK